VKAWQQKDVTTSCKTPFHKNLLNLIKFKPLYSLILLFNFYLALQMFTTAILQILGIKKPLQAAVF